MREKNNQKTNSFDDPAIISLLLYELFLILMYIGVNDYESHTSNLSLVKTASDVILWILLIINLLPLAITIFVNIKSSPQKMQLEDKGKNDCDCDEEKITTDEIITAVLWLVITITLIIGIVII